MRPWRSPVSRYVPAAPVGSKDGRPGAGGAGGRAHPAGSALSRPARPPVPLPPQPMPLHRGTRPLKRWCYVGLFGPDLSIGAGTVHLGPVPHSFWAVWDRRAGVLDTEARLLAPGRTAVTPASVAIHSGPVRLELAVTPAGEPVEVVSPHGRSYIWTRKTPIRAGGHLAVGMEIRPVSGLGILDESAGYHARDTGWEWSAGVGTTIDGWPVVWNLVRGIHDSATMSERTVWVNGRPAEAPVVRFSTDLDEVWGADGSVLRFEEEATWGRRENLGLVRSDYTQPFGRFEGTLPGGVELSQQDPAFGVMERHRARW